MAEINQSLGWNGKRPSWRPSSVKACGYSGSLNARATAPLLEGEAFTVKHNAPVVRSVVLLLAHQRPAAILRLVMPVIINTLNRVFVRWRKAHIFKEILKCLPSVANADASRAVAFPTGRAFSAASCYHVPPAVMNWRSRPTMSKALPSALWSCKHGKEYDIAGVPRQLLK